MIFHCGWTWKEEILVFKFSLDLRAFSERTSIYGTRKHCSYYFFPNFSWVIIWNVSFHRFFWDWHPALLWIWMKLCEFEFYSTIKMCTEWDQRKWLLNIKNIQNVCSDFACLIWKLTKQQFFKVVILDCFRERNRSNIALISTMLTSR